jgi:hypothetical protein
MPTGRVATALLDMKSQNGSLNGDCFLLVSSAHDPATLENIISAISNVVSRCGMADLAYTLAMKRSLFHHRAYAIVPKRMIESPLERDRWVAGVQKESVPTLGFAFTGRISPVELHGRLYLF